MNQKAQAVLASYARSFAVAMATVALNGETNGKAIVLAGLAAIVGPGIRAINPKDPAFGIIANQAQIEVDKLLKAELTKKPVKKAAPKKTAK